MKKVVLVVAWLVSLIVAAGAASSFALKHQLSGFNADLQETQAQLWFNHLLQFREIESDLSKGCSSEALERTRIAIDYELHLLSEFHKDYPSSSLNKYISDRDPKLLGQLESFKSKYGNSWTVPQCAK
jgi:hypothetical protein